MFYDALASILAGAMANDKADVKMKINGKDVDATDLFKDLNTLVSKYTPEEKVEETEEKVSVCPKCGKEKCVCEEDESKYTTTYSAPVVKVDEDTKVGKTKSAEEMLEEDDPLKEPTCDIDKVADREVYLGHPLEEFTCDIDKVADCEVYLCHPFVAGMESADDPIIIPFESYVDGKAVTGITDEQLVAILAHRYRFDEERFEIVMQLIQTYYGK